MKRYTEFGTAGACAMLVVVFLAMGAVAFAEQDAPFLIKVDCPTKTVIVAAREPGVVAFKLYDVIATCARGEV
ncbi:MAG: hypothetical protein ACRCVX_15185 [Shewanella sp.]